MLVAMTIGLTLLFFPMRSDTLNDLAAGDTLRVGYAIEPPFVTQGADGKLSGEAPVVLEAVLARAGIRNKVEWLRSDFGSLIHELESGRIQIIASGMFVTPERERRVIFSRPTALVHTGLLMRGSLRPAPATLSEFSAREDLQLAVLGGAVEEAMARKAGIAADRIVSYPDTTAALQAIQEGRVDAFALSTLSLRYILQQHGGANFQLAPDAQPDAEPGRPAFVFRPGDKALRDLVDRQLASFLGSEEHRALVAPFGFQKADLPAAEAAR